MMAKLVAIVLAIIGAGIVLSLLRSRGTISGLEARRLVGEGATLVDVRTRAEFSTGHIQGAINVPVDELARRLAEVGDKSEPVVVYCRSGSRSRRAKRLLEREGFVGVYDLGGIGRW